MKTKTIIPIITAFLVVPIVSAAVSGPEEIFGKLWMWVSKLFMFEWALNHSNDTFGAFMRLVIWITLFTVLYAIGSTFLGPGSAAGGGGSRLFRTRGQVGIVTGLLAVLCVIFIRVELLVAIAETYSTVGAFVMLIVPIGGLTFLIYETRRLDVAHGGTWSGRAVAVLRLAMIFLVWIILNVVTTAVGGGL